MKPPSYPIGITDFVVAGDILTVANMLPVLADYFADRSDITAEERAAIRVAHAAMSQACGPVWRRAYEAHRQSADMRATEVAE